MTFAQPQILLFLWLVPLAAGLFWFGARKRKRAMDEFAERSFAEVVAPGPRAGARTIKAGLVLAASVLVIIGLAGPRYGFQWQEVHRKGVDLMICLDCSRSMLATDVKPDRLARAKREIEDLLNMLQGDRVGLVAFAGTAFLQCPLTLDYSALDLFLSSLTPDFLPVGGTDLAGALETALDSFDPEADTDKAIIVITDGEATTGDPLKAAEAAREKGVKVFCIGVGQEGGAPVPEKGGGFKKDEAGNIIVSRLDSATLEKIASMTGGRFVRSTAGDMDLDAVYKNDILGSMEAADLEEGRIKVHTDRAGWFFALAALLLALELFVGRRRALLGPALVFAMLCSSPAMAATVGEGFDAYGQGDYDLALAIFQQMEKEHPDDPRLLMALGDTLYKLGRFDEARSYFGKVRQASEEDAGLKGRAMYNEGNTAFRQGKADEAVKLYEQALELDPGDKEAELNLEFVKQQQKQQQQQQSDQNQDNKDQNKDKQDKQDQGQQDQDKDQNKDQDKDKDKDQDKGQDQKDGQDKQDSQDQQDQNDKQDQQQDQQQNQQQDQQDQQGSQDQQQTGQPQEQPAQSPDMARQMLNRLEDKPGKALMPRTGGRNVRKDW